MVGSPDYTSVGRPYVESARAICSVEENSRTEKVIIFKKKRRKTYQRNKGHRQDITVVRVLKILYLPSKEVIDNYKKLGTLTEQVNV